MGITKVSRTLAAALSLTASAALSAQGTTQGTTIAGRVTSQVGAPIPGAYVFLQGLNVGAQTDGSGRYSFTVDAARSTGQAATLTARVLSYTASSAQVTLTPGQTISQDFILAPNPLHLGEVVVTGAGTSTTRERLTTVINTIDSARIRRAAMPQNVVSALAGQVPNVEIRTQSGDPGASASMKIRGTSSLTGNGQPLFVVDGQPIDNTTQATAPGGAASMAMSGTVTPNRVADINPDDIESVEILKGSSAAFIYGARGSNGVVLITTKRGRSGPTRATFTSTESFDRVDPRIPLQTKYGQGDAGAPPTAGCGVVSASCTPNSWGPLLPAGTPVYDHEGEILQTGLSHDNFLGLSGGNERLAFYLSGGLTGQRGFVVGPNNKYARTDGRLKASEQVTSTLVVGGNFNYVDTRGNYLWKGNSASGLLVAALRTPPDFNNLPYLDPVNGQHRSYRFPNPTPLSATTGRGYDNPFFVANVPQGQSELARSIGNLTADWTPREWLSVHYTLGSDAYTDERFQGFPQSSSAAISAPLAVGQVIRNTLNYFEVDHNLVAAVTHDLASHVSGTFTVGQNLNSRRIRNLYVQGTTLIAPQPFVLQNTQDFTSSEDRGLAHIAGYFAQAELGVYEQLVAKVGMRNDGYSTFGASKRRADYPSAGLAWTFTDVLRDMPGMRWVSYGKARFAYGETGKEPPLYAAAPNAFTNDFGFGSGNGDELDLIQSGQSGLTSSPIIGNPGLAPERSREREGGVDLGFFDQTVDLNATMYSKRSTGVILPVTVNTAQTGALTRYLNGAAISNKGVELSLNARPYTTKNVAVEIGAQYGRNKGRVLSLSGTDAIRVNSGVEGFVGAIGTHRVGYAPGVLSGFDFVRCGRGIRATISGVGTGADVDSLCTADGSGSGAVVLGANGQPIVDPTDRVIADPHPKYTVGYTGTVTLHNRLRFSTLIDVRKGGEVVNATRSFLERIGTHANTLVRDQTDAKFGVNYKTKEFPNVTGPGVGVVAFSTYNDWYAWFQGNGGIAGPLSQFVEDGSFVKLRELSLTYTVDRRYLPRAFGFSSADVRVAGRNLHTWTRYTGLDPEADLAGAQYLTQGLDYFNDPQARSFVLSVSLNR